MVNDGRHLVFRFGDFELREKEHRLLRSGEEIHLQPQVFRLLLYLVHNRDRVVQKDEIVREVWDSAAVTDNSLTRSIYLLRKILDDDPADSRAIRTVSSIGYQFICAVQQAEDGATSSKLAEVTAAIEESSKTDDPATSAAASAGDQDRIPRKLHRVWLSASVLGALVLLAAGVWYLRQPLPPPSISAYSQLTHDGKNKGVAATDGIRLYVNFSSPSHIAQIGINGGDYAPIPISLPGSFFVTDISPDGSQALINDLGPSDSSYSQWVAPVLGGAARRLDDHGYFGAFSPDGGSVIYSTRAGDIFMIRPDGTAKHKLAGVAPVPVGASAIFFAWSPDRRSIRFTNSDGHLWEMNADGSGLHLLLPKWKEQPNQCCGRWTQDGRFYLFFAGGQLWALDERRGLLRRPPPDPIQLTSGQTWGQPVLARDGKTIFVDGSIARGELSRIDPKTGDLRPFLGGISAQDVSFSPDGKSVAYVSYPDGALWKADRDGSNRLQIAAGPSYNGNPRWSPDSKEIVFGTLTPDVHLSIHRVSAVDGSPLWLNSEETAGAHDPNWSPDGKRVLYATGIPTSASTPVKQDLRIVDLRTHQTTIVPESEGKWSPRWSPDGRYIVALFGGQLQAKLPVLDLATGHWRTIPVNGGAYLSFSHDSKFIYYLRRDRDQGVFRVPVAGGREQRVVDMTDWHLAGYFGYSMSLDPTDAPLILRDIGSDDIYALTLEVK